MAISNFTHPLYLTPPLKGFPLEFDISARVKKTRMMGLPYGRKSFKIDLAIQTQYRRVTDIQPSFDSKDRAYVFRRAGNDKLK